MILLNFELNDNGNLIDSIKMPDYNKNFIHIKNLYRFIEECL